MEVLDSSKIDTQKVKWVNFADIDGDTIKELVGFHPTSDNCCNFLIYKPIFTNWDLTDQPILTIEGKVVDSVTANFDADLADEILIASHYSFNSSRIYLLDYSLDKHTFNSQIFLEIAGITKDVALFYDDDTDLLYLGVLTYLYGIENIYLPRLTVFSIEKGEIRWASSHPVPSSYIGEKIIIGHFYDAKNLSVGILGFDDIVISIRQYFLDIFYLNSEISWVKECSISHQNKIQDIQCFDFNNDGIDEILQLESQYKGKFVGYDSYYKIYPLKEGKMGDIHEERINSTQILTQISGISTELENRKLILLDPTTGYCRYVKAIDSDLLTVESEIDTALTDFEETYWNTWAIDVECVGRVEYTSISSDDDISLFTDLKTKVPNSIRVQCHADIVIGFNGDTLDSSGIGGRGEQPGVYSIIFWHNIDLMYRTWWPFISYSVFYEIICHEVGHNYGLRHVMVHCNEPSCIMYASILSSIDFCSYCTTWLSPNRFPNFPDEFQHNWPLAPIQGLGEGVISYDNRESTNSIEYYGDNKVLNFSRITNIYANIDFLYINPQHEIQIGTSGIMEFDLLIQCTRSRIGCDFNNYAYSS